MQKVKKCAKCGKVKILSKFFKSKQCVLGVRPECASCHKKEARVRRRTKTGLINQMYENQIKRSNKNKWDVPAYSLSDFHEWCLKQDHFNHLYKKWVKSNYDKWEVPSCDRLNDYKPYSLKNLRIITWKQNFDKYQKDRIGGINNKQNQKVGKFTKNGKFIEEYHSIRFAARENKVNQGNLTACVNGRVKSAGGFIWKRLGIKYKSNSPIVVGENNK